MLKIYLEDFSMNLLISLTSVYMYKKFIKIILLLSIIPNYFVFVLLILYDINHYFFIVIFPFNNEC